MYKAVGGKFRQTLGTSLFRHLPKVLQQLLSQDIRVFFLSFFFFVFSEVNHESVALNPPVGSNRRPVVSNVSLNRVSRRRRRSPEVSPSSGQDRDRNRFRDRGLVAKVPANNLVKSRS